MITREELRTAYHNPDATKQISESTLTSIHMAVSNWNGTDLVNSRKLGIPRFLCQLCGEPFAALLTDLRADKTVFCRPIDSKHECSSSWNGKFLNDQWLKALRRGEVIAIIPSSISAKDVKKLFEALPGQYQEKIPATQWARGPARPLIPPTEGDLPF